MKIAGINYNSFIDYPGCIAAVVFTAGCNLDCNYCHNHRIIDASRVEPLDTRAVLDELHKRATLIDAVVVSGGEPTLQPQPDLADFLRSVRGMGLRTKLDTNGTRPDVIQALLEQELLDRIAMDIKATWDKYAAITRHDADTAAIRRSIAVIEASGVPHEFRTVHARELTNADLAEIRSYIGSELRVAACDYSLAPPTNDDSK